MKNLPSLPFALFSALLCVTATQAQVADVPNARAIAGIPVNNSRPMWAPTLAHVLDVVQRPAGQGRRHVGQATPPEIVKFYETQVYGRIPATAPKVTWTVTRSTGPPWVALPL